MADRAPESAATTYEALIAAELTSVIGAEPHERTGAHIDGRTSAKVAEWIQAQPDSWREGVTHVAIDLSASYAKAVRDALPNAVVVADRFHLVTAANDMLTQVRQHLTREQLGRRGEKKDPEWAARRRLLTAHEKLTPEAFSRLWNALIDAGDPGIEILHAYTVKENFRQLIALSGSNPDRDQIRARLWAGCTSWN